MSVKVLPQLSQFLDEKGRPKPEGVVYGRTAAIETWGPDLDARWKAGEIVCFGYDARSQEWRWLPDRDDLLFEESGRGILIGGRPDGSGMVYSPLVFYGSERAEKPASAPSTWGRHGGAHMIETHKKLLAEGIIKPEMDLKRQHRLVLDKLGSKDNRRGYGYENFARLLRGSSLLEETERRWFAESLL